ncbi:MAG: crosslink repair DNA glycosylase YcaQ family protein [Bacteroidota bacterium]
MALAEPTDLSKQEARKVILASQWLKRASVANQSVRRLARETIEQIGYVQIDTISVIERAHHHVFWARLPTYTPDVLARLERDRVLFEYWSHAASYLPMRDFRFTLPMKQTVREKDKFWFQKDHKVMQHVLDRIASEGPLMSKDFEKPEGFKVKAMWEAAPTKQALQNLFMEGRIMVKGRQGFQKVYDLTERVLPENVDTSLPTRQEYIQYLIKRDVRAHGILSSRQMGYLLKGCQGDIKEQVTLLLEMGSIMPCKIGKSSETYFTSTTALESLNRRFINSVRLLSPFDNLVINRERTKELFGFAYLLECYVPAGDRSFGYFALPILWKNNLVGQIDVKANRSKETLELKNISLLLRSVTEEFLHEWHKSLKQFMNFQGVHQVDLTGHRSDLGTDLMQVLFSVK